MAVHTARTGLHELVDELTEEQLPEARRYVEFVKSGYTDMLMWVLDTAPVDDEPSTPEEDREAEEAWQEYLRDGGMSLDEARRTLLS